MVKYKINKKGKETLKSTYRTNVRSSVRPRLILNLHHNPPEIV